MTGFAGQAPLVSFTGRAPSSDVMTLRVRNHPPGAVVPSRNGNLRSVLGCFAGIGRVELFWEGVFVWGGRYGRAFFLVVLVGVTLSPSGDGIALPVWWRRLDFEGFAWIGRVILPREGENVSLVVVVGWMCAWEFWV